MNETLDDGFFLSIKIFKRYSTQLFDQLKERPGLWKRTIIFQQDKAIAHKGIWHVNRSQTRENPI